MLCIVKIPFEDYPSIYQLVLKRPETPHNYDHMTDVYKELAERNNEIYSWQIRKQEEGGYGRNFFKKLTFDNENELISYDEKELRWRKPYVKISVEELEDMVYAERYK